MQKPPWRAVEVSCKRKKKPQPVHHMCRLHGEFLTWCAAAVRLVSLGISPFCLRVCAVMATAVWRVLGRREGWAVGKRPGFYKEDGRRARAWSKDRDAWWKAKSALVQKRRGSIYLPLSLLEGTMLLSCLADLKSAKPSICVETRSCLLNNRPACTMCVHFIHQGLVCFF